MRLDFVRFCKSGAFAFLLVSVLVASNLAHAHSVHSDVDDFNNSYAAHNGVEEVIHYVFVMDDNLESSDLQTSGFVRKQFNNFIHKIERECPRSLISVVRDTGELNALDAFIEEVDPLNYDQQKAGIDRELEEIKKQYANAYVWNGNVKAKIEWLEAKRSSIELYKKIQEASRTVIFIVSHGGMHHYQAGEFHPKYSSLLNEENMELVLLTCQSGNLDLSDMGNLKVFGLGSEHMNTAGVHVIAFLGYLNTSVVPVPVSALEFYKAYEEFYNQMPALLVLTILTCSILEHYVISLDLSDLILDVSASYYLKSMPAELFEVLTKWVPSMSTPWYADLEKGDYRGTKEGPWWLLVDSENYSYLNNALPFASLIFGAMIQLEALDQLPRQIRY